MSDEERIRETYRAYDATGRAHLWDGSNPGYARLAADRDRALLHLLARSLPADRAPAFLDVGCGDGSLVAAVAGRWPDVRSTGIDLLLGRIEVASTRVPGAAFVVGSADALPFADNSFDIVSAITLFSSIPSEQMEAAVAAEVGRVLRPGGWLIWYDLRYDNPGNPAVHGLSGGRLAHLFPGWTRELRSLTVAPPLARRLGRLTPVAYPLLHAVPPLRSHLVGRLRCPA
jgi:ubiquinone/menaquinone biosynthesis C-methylase UbiE